MPNRLSVRAFALTVALVWAGVILFVGVINRFAPEYGWWFLQVVDSIYPGYDAVYGLKNLIVGVLYGLLDGLIGGAIFALVYNFLLGKLHKPTAG